MSIHEWGWGETDVEAAAREESDRNLELVEWERELYLDRMRRNDPAKTLCGVCHERAGRAIYGLLCAGCFEARRQERETA